MSEIIFEVREDPECGYRARALGYAIFTQGETMNELKEMVRDAVRLYFEKDTDFRLQRFRNEQIGISQKS